MSEEDYKAEIARLHEFTRRLAQRLFLAAEVLAMRAEKRTRNATTDTDHSRTVPSPDAQANA